MAEKKTELIHDLVPEHSKLSEKDAKALYKNYSIVLRDMPKILIDDEAIAHLDVKEGDIIKIKRNSRTAGEMHFYRGVIKG